MSLLDSIPQADQDELKAALQTWQKDGTENPLIPVDVDVNGDGKPDAVGLDKDGNLIAVTDADLSDTVYESDGSGVEVGGE
jgi:hypothetical protein